MKPLDLIQLMFNTCRVELDILIFMVWYGFAHIRPMHMDQLFYIKIFLIEGFFKNFDNRKLDLLL